MASHRDLIVWQKAMELSVGVYGLTRGFPPDELYGLTSQLRRAAVSVASNLAEGYGRASRPDFRRLRRSHADRHSRFRLSWTSQRDWASAT